MMRKNSILLTLAWLSKIAVGSNIQEIHIPSGFRNGRFANYYSGISSNSGNSSCDKNSSKNFYPPEYTTLKIKRPPFNTWLCLFAVDVTHDGYGPGSALPEKVYFDEKKRNMEKQKGVKKSLSFCLIRDEVAFCGSGSMINLVDGKEVDFTPYMLKSFETVEMGLPEKSNN